MTGHCLLWTDIFTHSLTHSGEGGEDPVRWKPLADVDGEGNSPTFPHLKGLRNGDIATSKVNPPTVSRTIDHTQLVML